MTIVGPDLGPNCLPMLSADNTVRQRVKDDQTNEVTKRPTVKKLTNTKENVSFKEIMQQHKRMHILI